MKPLCLTLLCALAAGTAAAQQTPATTRVPVVAVAGCVVQDGTTYTLRSATEPTPSIANSALAALYQKNCYMLQSTNTNKSL